MRDQTSDTNTLVEPTNSLARIDLFEALRKGVDVASRRAHQFPTVRGGVGVGVVQRDTNQIFAQWESHRSRLPLRLEELVEFYPLPCVAACIEPGIETY